MRELDFREELGFKAAPIDWHCDRSFSLTPANSGGVRGLPIH